MPLPTVFRVFLRKGKIFSCKLNFSCRLILGASIHEKIFKSDLLSWPKIRQRMGAGGWQPLPPPTEQKLTYFSNHESDIQSQQILVWNKIVSR